MTIVEFLAAISVKDDLACDLKVVVDGKAYDIDRVGIMNVDMLPDPDPEDCEVHLFARNA